MCQDLKRIKFIFILSVLYIHLKEFLAVIFPGEKKFLPIPDFAGEFFAVYRSYGPSKKNLDFTVIDDYFL